MKRQLAGYAVRADDQGPVVWLASSPDKARDGLRIPVEAWDTSAFEKQGSPLMWAHQYNEAPIGRVTKLTRTKAGLVAETEFTSLTQRGRETEQLVRAGFLNCCSVGFEILDLDGDTVKRSSLTELSVVPIGSDINAVALARSAFEADQPFILTPTESGGYSIPWYPDIYEQTRQYREVNPSEPDSTPPARATWDETAASMVRLIVSPAQRPESERVTEYRALAREYARHGKTPPELLDAEITTALGEAQLRGLFLEGEPDLFPNTFALVEVRAGAVFSKRNLDALDQAIEILTELRSRAAKEEKSDESEDDTLERLYRAFVGDKPA